ncbi:2381_t:CDS:2 [Funneliformis caledonium]|uniref:2381_t:CDS:1 n=1 Tax=Funneliformis caledonium TaxID=1117310 RepID=A0A9N9A912_9GLOM|nr:2381_t:CDS:2 [Funneliformis caledonium]
MRENYNFNHCYLSEYEKAIRDTDENFSIEDYEVFQILKNKTY